MPLSSIIWKSIKAQLLGRIDVRVVCPNLIQDNEYRIASALRGKPTLWPV